MSRQVSAARYNALRITVAAALLLVCLPWTLGRTELDAVTVPVLAMLFGSVFAGFGIGDTAFFESIRRLGVALGGVVTVVSATLFLWSVALIGAARTAAIASSSPLFAAPMAVVLFRERLTLRLVLGMAISTAGVVLIVLGG